MLGSTDWPHFILHELISVKFIVLYIFLASALYVHFRGKVRHKFGRQLTDHSTFMAPYNAMIYLFSSVKNTPVLDAKDFPQLDALTDNWETIREEARKLYDGGHIQISKNYNDLAFNTFFKRGWKRFYLKWYGDTFPSARDLCPKTVELVQSIPTVNAALFALMPGRSKLGEHRDPFAGSLRYHLGLITPNSDDCRIYIDGNPRSWRDGQAIMFDETYIHSVNNDTDQDRIILFCDVTRPIGNPIIRRLNQFVINHVVKITETQNTAGEKVGVLNHISSSVYRLKNFFQSIKKWNRKVYYLGKYAIMGGIVFLIFFAGYLHRHS
jgi:beta-hydroxylase